MGVYDHMTRPSMGHKLQVELRESMQRYHNSKINLQHHMSQLRFHSKDLYTCPLPPSPDPPVKRWGDPNSKFSKVPDVGAIKTHLAQLEEQNAHLTQQSTENELKVKNCLLPPIQDNSTNTDRGKTAPTPLEQTAPTRQNQTPRTHTEKPNKPVAAKASTKPSKIQLTRKADTTKGGKFQQKKTLKKPVQQQKNKPLPLLKLPTIHSASMRRNVWDSGHNHTHFKGPSTHLEKNQVDEDCRTFSQRSIPIPLIVDTKRTEIQRPLRAQLTDTTTKIKITFTRYPPVTDNRVKATSLPADKQVTQQSTVDHFPPNNACLPESDDGSTVGHDSEDEMEGAPNRQRVQRPALPAIPLLPVTNSSHTQQTAAHHVPRLRLQRGLIPSVISTATVRSGATGATYMSLMSHKTQEWKNAYMSTVNPYYRSHMLMEILHATRQRMQDNEEYLRLCRDLPQPEHKWRKEGRSDIMVLHGDRTASNDATAARSSVPQQKLLQLPHHKIKQAAGRQKSQSSKLHHYLNKLSKQRKCRQQRHHGHSPFHLASMPIREITQSSLEHHSALQTAS